MAEENKVYNLNIELRLEPILVSLNKDNYKTMLDILVQGVKEYDPEIPKIVEKYTWVVQNQFEGMSTPTVDTLRQIFPELIFDNTYSLPNDDALSDYIYMFISQKKHRKIGNVLHDIADKVKTQGLSDEDTNIIYNYLSSAETDGGYVNISDVFEEQYDKLEKLVGISFLCTELDSLTGGITPGQVCTILGAPGSMKTTYSSNIAYNAIKDGKNVLYLSLEEPSLQLYSKWLSRCSVDTKTPIPQKDIVQRSMDAKQKETIFKTVAPKLKSYPGKLYIVDEQDLPDYQLTTFESKFKEIDKMAIAQTGHGIDLLVVDHIQILKFGVAGMDTFAAINFYVSFFRKQALDWLHSKRQISVILLSQANREGYAYAQKHDGLYLTQHVAEASEVERASSYIISVYTNAMTQITNQLTLGAIKLRSAPLPASVIPIYEDGSVYQVGNTIQDTATVSSSVSTSVTLSDINSMLGGGV